LIILFGLIAAIIGIGLAFVISTNLSNAIKRVVDVVLKAASGDLRNSVQVKSKDEIGTLAFSINEIMDNLRKM
jgi:methyl-accepting chemotaxis protein